MNLHEILSRLAAGELSVDEAEARLGLSSIAAVEDFARLDLGRHGRKGVPEVVFARGKSPDQIEKICAQLLEHTGRAIVSGLSPEDWQSLGDAFPGRMGDGSRQSGMLVLRQADFIPPQRRGRIGLLTAGTADVAVAEQARIIAEEMGCEVITAYDVGVAGMHRLAAPLTEMVEAGIAAVIVAAGMEGALPSVVAGLVSVPVIGLPTSIGYGLGGNGITALLSVLQSCCPGLVAVNIDNGVGAGATAALIARRADTDPSAA